MRQFFLIFSHYNDQKLKKFPKNSTVFDISEFKHDFSIEKKKGKSPTCSHCKCNSSDNYKTKLRSFDKILLEIADIL